jgi:glycosyltransferase involved in cell wall biosynthesis
MVEKKGFPILMRAAAMLAAEGIEFELAIIGDGPQRDELERLANGLGLANKVYFPGFLPIEEVIGTYRYADVFALTPIVAHDGDRDGLPNAIIEAMACGVPVVSTNVGGVPELVVHEQTGLLAQPGNVQEIAQYLERALIDQPLRQKITANAWRRVARDHDADRNAHALGSVFAELLKLRKWPPVPDAGGGLADVADVIPE